VRSVILYPDKARGNDNPHEPRATIDKDGNFEVFATPNRPGAPPGYYKVAIHIKESPTPDDKNPYVVPKWLINDKYGDPDKSGLTLQVVEDANAVYELKIAN